MNAFNRNALREPPAYFWPGYFWVLNDAVDEQKMLDQLRDMRAHDARSVCLLPEPPEFRPNALATRLDRPYLSPSYLELIGKLVAECSRLGMNYWFYDEGGWPSGGACGQVCGRDPEKFSGKVMVPSENGPRLKPISYGCVPYPDLLKAGATQTFIEITHEAHKPYIGAHFGRTVRFAFTDEPMAYPTHDGQLTWSDDMADVFKRQKGYDLMPCLEPLLQPPADDEDARITRMRIDFYDVWSRLFVARYLHPIRDWCHANGLLSAGHFGGEDEPSGNAHHGFGHILRALRGLDIPGVDAIWRQLFPGLRSHQFPKYASSVARQMGQPLVLTESFAVYGNGITPAQLKWITDQQFVRGATLMVMACYPYSSRDHFMAGERTHFGPNDPLWKYMDIFHGYVARLAYLLTRGQPVCSTAVYFDIPGIWAGGATRQQAIARHDQVADELLKTQCDFDYIDDDVLTHPTIHAGWIHVGPMAYDTIVVPSGKWMASAARAGLEEFRKAGGKVVTTRESAVAIAPVVKLTPSCGDIRACKRAGDGSILYFLTNEADRAIRVQIGFAEAGQPVLCDPLTGELGHLPFKDSASGTTIEFDFAPWGSALIMFGVPADRRLPEFQPSGQTLALVHGWSLRPLRRHQVGERDFEVTDLPDSRPTPVMLGDWATTLGSNFSGDAEYEIAFESPVAGRARLDLGEVRYACRVVLNEREVKRLVWKPFVAEVDVREGRNKLQVVVTNTLANAIVDPDVYAVWLSRLGKSWPAGALHYDQTARKFEAESLASGLFGPVQILFAQRPCAS